MLRDLTLRARCFLGAGLAAVVCGVQLGQSDFVRIGLAAIAVPLLAWLLVRARDPRLQALRRVGPARVQAGESAQVELELRNPGRRTPPLTLEELLPAELGHRRGFALGSLAAGASTTVGYPLRTSHRGRLRIGPLRTHARDPLGMVDLARELPGTGSLLVTPRTEPLPTVALAGRWAGAGDNRARELLGGGTPDVSIRGYVRGDDLRRVHWPSSARHDALMVRREEQEWQLRCTVLVDDRRRSHVGSGRASTLETSVVAAASVLTHLAAHGFAVSLATAAGPVASTARSESGGAAVGEQLEHLALLGLSPLEGLDLRWLQDARQGGLIVAVLGGLDRVDQQVLGGVAAAGGAAHALVVDPDAGQGSWSTEADQTVDALRRHGWRAAGLPRAGSVAAAWTELGR